MKTNTYVGNGYVVDTESGKPYNIVNERSFTNISIATGWKPSTDGLFSYYKDVLLPVDDNDEFPITLTFSPFVMIPQNAVSSCKPSNFPYARTISNNTVRIYAYRVPDAVSMLPITIVMKEVNTSEGTTNGAYDKDSDKDIVVEKTTIQVAGTSFVVPISDENITEEEVTIKMLISAYKGETPTKMDIALREGTETIFNMDGTVVKEEDYNIEVKSYNESVNSLSMYYSAKIPKGTLIKDRMLYFVVPVSTNGNFFARATLTATRDRDVSNKVMSYDIIMPKLGRNAANHYFSNGEPVGVDGIDIEVIHTTANGDRIGGEGSLIFENADNDEFIAESLVSSGVSNIIDLTVFNNYTNVKVTYKSGGVIRDTIETTIDTDQSFVYISTSEQYVIPYLVDGRYVINPLSINAYTLTSNNVVEPFYGRISVVDSNGNIVYNSNKIESRALVEFPDYQSDTIPMNYKIEIKDDFGETRVSKFISVIGQSESEDILQMEILPGTLIIPYKPGSNPTADFTVKMYRGNFEITERWDYEIVSSTLPTDLKIIKDPNIPNVFKVLDFKGSAITAVVKVQATNKTNNTQKIEKDLLITKLIQDGQNLYTYFKYGEPHIGEEGYEIVLTIDPDGVLRPGELPGPYYGILSTDNPSNEYDSSLYRWFLVDVGEIEGEPGVPGAAFYISGNNIIKATLDSNGNIITSPSTSLFKLKSLSDLVPEKVEWQIQKRVENEDPDEDFNNEVWETVHEDDDTYLFIPSESIVKDSDVIYLRVKTETLFGDKVLTNYAYMNINIIYTETGKYAAQLRGVNTSDKDSHIFPVDVFGTPLEDLKENPIKFTIDVYSGLIPMEYGVNYEVLSIENYRCETELTEVDGKPIISFKSIADSDGKVLVNLIINDELVTNKEFYWSTVTKGGMEDTSVKLESNRRNFSIKTATLSDINNWRENVSNYKDNFIKENEDIQIKQNSIGTVINRISVSTYGGFGNEDLVSQLDYSNNESGFLTPLSLVETVFQDEYSGYLLPSLYYIVCTKEDANMNIVDYRESIANIDLDSTRTFHGYKFNIIKAPAGSERFTIKSDSAPLVLYFEPITAMKDNITDDMIINSKLDLELLESSGVPIPIGIYGYQDGKIKLNNELEELIYVEYLESGLSVIGIKPAIAASQGYFNPQYANATIEINVEGYFREGTTMTISRDVYPYDDLKDILNNLHFISSGKYYTRDSLLTLEYARTTIEQAKNGLIDYIENSNSTVVTKEREPVNSSYSMLLEKMQKPNGEFYHKLKVNNPSDPEGVDNTSFMGASLFENSFYILEFDIEQTESQSIEFTFRNKNNDELFFLSEPKIFTGNRRFSFLLPPRGMSVDESKTKVKDYFQKYSIGNLDLFEIATGRPQSIDGFMPLYVHNNMSKEVANLSNISLKELRLSTELEVEIYEKLKSSIQYENMKNKTSSFIQEVDYLVETLNGDPINIIGSSEIETPKWEIGSETTLTKDENISILSKVSGNEVQMASIDLDIKQTGYHTLIAEIESEKEFFIELGSESWRVPNGNVSFSHSTLIEELGSVELSIRAAIPNENIVVKISNITLTNDNQSNGYIEISSRPKTVLVLYADAEKSIRELESEINRIKDKENKEAYFKTESDSRSYMLGFANSEGMISYFQITPDGTVLEAEKHKIIGSTSISELYGKKMVIGKDITDADIAFDKEYRETTKGQEGLLAVWDRRYNVWSSVINQNGQFFMRYKEGEAGDRPMIGYMVMDSSEIAAYNFNQSISENLSEPIPMEVGNIREKYPIFKIDDSGYVEMNKIRLKNNEESLSTLDLFDNTRVMYYDNKLSEGVARKGIVFINIGGEN